MPDKVIPLSRQREIREQDEPREELVFEVVPRSGSVQVGDDVTLRVNLHNAGDDDVVINSRMALNGPSMPGEVVLRVVGPSGKPIPFSARIRIGAPNRKEDFSSVAPGASVGRQYTISDYYRMDRAGTYTIRGTYTNKSSGDELGLDAWTGRLESEPVTVELHKKS